METSCPQGPKNRYIGLPTQEVLFLESRARNLLACSGSQAVTPCQSGGAKQRGEGQAPRQVAEEQANILSYPASRPAKKRQNW